MNFDMIPSVYNFLTEEYEYVSLGDDLTDEKAVQYISQYPAALGLYKVKRLMGESVIMSMKYVLEACAGVPHEE